MNCLTYEEIYRCESECYGGCKGKVENYKFNWHYTPRQKYIIKYGEEEDLCEIKINLCQFHYNILEKHHKQSCNGYNAYSKFNPIKKYDIKNDYITVIGWDYQDALDNLLYPCDSDWYPEEQIVLSSL